MTRASTAVLALLGCVAITSTAVAESTPEALQWLGRLADAYHGEPFTYSYDVRVNVTDMGQTVPMRLEGRSTQSDRTRFRIEATMEMTMPGAESPVKIRLIGVSDGEVMWVETDNPTGSGSQVIKMPLDKLEQIAETNPWARNFTRMDPVGQVEELARLFDFAIADSSDHAVTLRAEVTGEGLEAAKEVFPGTDPAALTEIVLVIDAVTAFPKEMRVGDDPPTMVMRFGEPERLGEVDDALFVYTPPEGAALTDLGALIEGTP
jgi:outer membrane lipoprotein-sorting protein